MLLPNRLKEIEKRAISVINDFAIKKPPVPIIKIAKKLGLKVLEYNLGNDASGVLVIENNKGTIAYNPKDSSVRQRFTIAHELGHYLLHHNNSEVFVDKDFLIKFRNNTNSYTPTEIAHEQEANAFAAALLMPKKFIEEEMAKKEFASFSEIEFIEKLAAKFEVSTTAMTFRLTNLNMQM
jgi:Zn-dependent peptidase ImmA (M78 family)